MTAVDTPFPPPPWRSTGTLWAALLTTCRPLPLPPALRPLGSPQRLVMLLIRYRHGTLRYDEFALASPARSGVRAGLFTHHIWVDTPASLSGGRQIWGVSKELAHFAWSRHSLLVSDDDGPIAGLRFGPRGPRLPTLPALGPAFGQRDGRLLHFTSRLTGRIARHPLHITTWAPRLPRLDAPPRQALTVDPCHMTVPAPGHRRRCQ
ncbi:acetoacetate decarboxylase family protein [Streptomyces sp. NPDC000151]|uniref:acetoacetate decarboxylase family protein n=1 Tax=Streptomyces sp. NPDC000151 TaxID=3154244 RepID=UPI00331FC670